MELNFSKVKLTQDIVDEIRTLQTDGFTAPTHLDTIRRLSRRIVAQTDETNQEQMRDDLSLLQGLQQLEDLVLTLTAQDIDE